MSRPRLWFVRNPAVAEAQADTEYPQWRERLEKAAKDHDAAEELSAVTTIGHRWNWAISTLPTRLIGQVLRETEEARLGDARIEFLRMLYDVRWRYGDASEPSRAWLQLALSLVEHNRDEEAIAVAAHITGLYSLIALQADNRFKRIARSEFIEANVARVAKKNLEWWQLAATNHPRSLYYLVEVANSLQRLQRNADIPPLTEPVLSRNVNDKASLPDDDVDAELTWVFVARARALIALGAI